ncbi:DUF389 domain-containing protein [Acaryochloris sp. 'Moss Beach']|uniref:DUF389 domain-containing protein n=1 Tax=Acaryochloris TaxID=155977 RepID=UPI001BB09520|nr:MULTISPECIES: DUF389 domain-containing protein [Acaryochloris]QUY42391.1 DUF389 domain-containing protein [Acaryochloris marina S15]UJB71486.1 DUF389 domain-containing protein [Acaryochloris sp. 'Moss Beach']
MAIHLRNWLADHLEISPRRKAEIYHSLLDSVSLGDISYWLQVLFSAGIATLGLVLNSPAVIIGAMLISPLMGGILANGLAFAVGDLVLGTRAIVNLAVSCLAAIVFAILIIAPIPFKELTPEIAARTQPNALDLFIALFSGALGSIATAKEPKGVVTSIPGVAIAVALMPPLCVVGYGIGIRLSSDVVGIGGFQVARGGGLLFLTNLAAITLMSMLVFLALNIGMPEVKSQAVEWHEQDPESRWVKNLLTRLPVTNQLQKIGSLPSRLAVILLPILVLLVPLSQSFSRLQTQLAQKQEDNALRRLATTIWQGNFANTATGEPRSYISQLNTTAIEDKLTVQLTVFTSEPYTLDERQRFRETLARQLNRPANSLDIQLIEILTASNELLARLSDDPVVTEPITPEASPISVSQAQVNLLQTVDTALGTMVLPAPALPLRHEVSTSAIAPLTLKIFYLSNRDIGGDAQTLLREDLRNRLQSPMTQVILERVPTFPTPLTFELDLSAISPESQQTLNQVGTILQQQPNLSVDIVARAETLENPVMNSNRIKAVQTFLTQTWRIDQQRINSRSGPELERGEQPTILLKINM